MEASLPLSGAASGTGDSPARTETAGRPARAAATAPSLTLPLRFVAFGLVALVLGVVWLIQRPMMLTTYHYNQFVIAETHLFVLGWILSVIMGAMYQLVPVALETRLYSERLAKWQFAVHVVGVIGMVWMFYRWDMKQVGHFGSALAIGVGLFVYNIARTLLRVPKWNVTATAVASGLVWISLTVFAGLTIAAGKCSYESTEGLATAGGVRSVVAGLRSLASYVGRFDQISAMHAHAHLGAVGLFVMLLVGVSYKLIPMFTLSEVQSKRRAVWSVVLLNLGLAGAFITILLRSPWKLAFTLVIIAALAIYGWELRAIVRARNRRVLDWGVKTFLIAITLFAPLSVLAIYLSWPGLPLNVFTGQLENLYGFLGLIGIVTLAIIGMLYKVIPFLVWFGTYSRHIGRAQVPSLAELFSERLQVAGLWFYLSGLVVVGMGIVAEHKGFVCIGGGLIAASLLTLAINIGLMGRHFFQPQLKPFPVRATAKAKA